MTASFDRGAKPGTRDQPEDGRELAKTRDGGRSQDGAKGSALHRSERRRRGYDHCFRRHTPLPLDDCLYTLQPSIPHLTRSALHRCLQRNGISRRPDVDIDKPKRQRFKRYSSASFRSTSADLQTTEGKLHLFAAIDRTSKFSVIQLVDKAERRTVREFLEHLLEVVPTHPELKMAA